MSTDSLAYENARTVDHRATMILREFGELIGSVEQARATAPHGWAFAAGCVGNVITEF